MSIQNYTYKLRLNPTQLQKVLLNKHFGACRFVYNYFLNVRKTEYLENQTKLNYHDNAKSLTELKKDEKYWWLKEINSQSLQWALKNLENGYQNFFEKRAGFPNFHNKYTKASFKVPQNVKVVNSKLIIPKFLDGIKLVEHRKIEGGIKFATLSKEPSGEYYVSITVEKEIQELPKLETKVGLDLGIKTLITSSDGDTYKNSKYFVKSQRKLAYLQKYLKGKVKGSGLRSRVVKKVARTHQKIKNQRKDTIHKATTEIIRKNQVIVIEDLNNKGMVRNRKLAKSLNDSSFGEIKRQLEYKSKWYGRQLIFVDRWFPSSKTCSSCGWINQNLTLKDRVFECSQCALKLDRDRNASLNILKQGLNIFSSGTGEYTTRAKVRPSRKTRQVAMKVEAPMPLGSV